MKFPMRRIVRLLTTGFAIKSVALAIVASGVTQALIAQSVSIPEEIEWTWEVRPAHPNPALPNVLLLGDSISRDYFPRVTADLADTANVYLMASSTSLGDPRLITQIAEFAAMEGIHFRVVHLNNGMHGWAYTEAQYEAAFPSFLEAVRKITGKDGRLIWTTITSVRSDTLNGASNARIDARNTIASRIAASEKLLIDDQHELMISHQDLHADAVHYTPAGSALQGDQAASRIRAALSRKE